MLNWFTSIGNRNDGNDSNDASAESRFETIGPWSRVGEGAFEFAFVEVAPFDEDLQSENLWLFVK